jgi:hypothetical protein
VSAAEYKVRTRRHEAHVPEEPQAELLGATRRVVVVLGLVIDRVDKVLYGEIVDPQAKGKYRFVGSDGIGGAINDWLRSGTANHRNGGT